MGRTLHHLGKNMESLLKKVEPLIKELLNPDGSYWSGKNRDDILRELADKIAVLHSTGQFSINVEDDEDATVASTTRTIATLTNKEASETNISFSP